MAQKRVPLTDDEAVKRIVATIRRAEPGTAPFSLVLGAGFSHGLVPTTREIVEESLPLWMESLKAEATFGELKAKAKDHRTKISRDFWSQFAAENTQLELGFSLHPDSGYPSDYGAAYRAAFHHDSVGALDTPALARKFQRDLMRLDEPRLNGAHFLLASLLGLQPGRPQAGRERKNELFKARGAFSRLILTTNFDPFLQIALQAVNRLYLMSDTPALGIGDEIFEEQADAIHLVYMHGSIQRRLQAATDLDIQQLKAKNAQMLAPVLKRRGVIVIGYSGWDDAIVEALAACDGFDHRLYWCGRENDPFSGSAFSDRVKEILQKPTASYVKIHSAGDFMAKLSRELVDGLPRLLNNPIAQVREMLEVIDLTEFESGSANVQPGPAGLQALSAPDALAGAKRGVIERLHLAEQAFAGDSSHTIVSYLLTSARASMALSDFDEGIKLLTRALDAGTVEAGLKADVLLERGLAYYFAGKLDLGQADWTSVIELPGAPVEWVAQARHNRGVTWGQRGDMDKAIEDYTAVIELPGAPLDLVAQGFLNRGVAQVEKGDTEKAIADYTKAIKLPGTPVEWVAKAHYNRGVGWGQRGETEKAISDFTALMELAGAPVEQVAQALYNRGVAFGQQGKTTEEIADYTSAIELPGAPVQWIAKALYNRGVSCAQRGDTERAIADYTAVMEMPGAPVEQVAKSTYNRGVRLSETGETEKAIADFTVVINLPGAPIDLPAMALLNRGVAWGRKGETDKEIADYAAVMGLERAPVEQVAQALLNRGVVWGQKGEAVKEIADYTSVLELPGAPVEQMAQALYNRGVAWGRKGESQKENEDYAAVSELPGAAVEWVAKALYNRGVARGQNGDIENALSDYGRVMELPGAPVEQVAMAILNRGVLRAQKGDSEGSIEEYTRVIDLRGAPTDWVAEGLLNRGVAWGQKGQSERELADYTALMALPDAPVEHLSKALANRGWLHYQLNEFADFLSDTLAALEKSSPLPYAEFNLGLALLANGKDGESLEAYERAAKRYPDQVESLAVVDLTEAESKWLTKERALPVRELLSRFGGGDLIAKAASGK